MKKKILVVLSMVAILTTSIPAPNVQAAWKVTDQGRQYTTNSTQGYATGWKKIKGYWYFFDQKGIMKTGWTYVKNNWYFLKSNGRMTVNSWIGNFYLQADGSMAKNTEINGIKIGADGTRADSSSGTVDASDSAKKKNGWYQSTETKAMYYYNDKGVMVKGWLTLPNGKYYMDAETGVMLTGFQLIGKQRYYFNPSTGTLKTGWYKVKGKRYYASTSGIISRNKWLSSNTIYTDKNGAAYTGWKTISGNKYYFNKSTAKKVTGWQQIESKWFYFDKNGIMAKSKWVTYPASGKKCYLQANGVMAASTWVGKYYVGSNGYKTGETRKKGLYTENGKTYYANSKYTKAKGWKTYKEKRYYFGDDYAALEGLQTIDNKKYYFDKDGVMQTGLIDIDDETYYFNADGSMLVNGSINIGGKDHNFGASGGYIKPETPVDQSKGAKIAAYAMRFLGNPYVYGGTSLTNGADCSGFTMSVMAHFGIRIPRVAADQAIGSSMWGGTYTKGKKITPNIKNLLPGDLIFYYSPIGHVSLYIGDGKVIHASNSTTGIIISNFNYSTPVGAMRYWA